MTAPAPAPSGAWTLVNMSADDSPATATATTLLGWLARDGVDLHTVLWLPGWTSTEPFEVGRFHDVARDHRWRLPQVLRERGRARLAGRLVGLAARRTLRRVPRGGVLYLNGASCVASLPYLPDGARTVVTHLHAADRDTDPALNERQVARLLDATDVWIADDPSTRDWAGREWGVPPEAFAWTGPVTDLDAWDRHAATIDPNALLLAVSGGTWFRRDHTARLVQLVRRLRPELVVRLLWTEVETEANLAPLLHDLDVLGPGCRLDVPPDHATLHTELKTVDLLALTAPQDDAPWLAWDAVTRGLPVVCFSTHPRAAEVGGEVEGRVVDYLDISAMAQAVLELGVDDKVAAFAARNERRAEVAAHDVQIFGDRLLGAVGGRRP